MTPKVVVLGVGTEVEGSEKVWEPGPRTCSLGQQRVRLQEGEWLRHSHTHSTTLVRGRESRRERSCEAGKRREQPTGEEEGKLAFPRPHDLFWL